MGVVQGATCAAVLFLAIATVSSSYIPYRSSHVFVPSPLDYEDTFLNRKLLEEFSTSTYEVKPPKPDIRMFHIESEISNRYARTLVKSKVANPANVSQEVVFSIIIPDTAFITSFAMEIDGKIYKAYVKEKEEAQRVYNEAVNRGQTAAHVSAARDAERFSVAVNIEKQSKVSFNLTYEELLQLSHGLYKHAININPGQIVPDMTIDVHIVEQRKIVDLKVNDVQSANEIDDEINVNPKAEVEWINQNETKIHFNVDKDEQRRLELKNKNSKQESGEKTPEGVAGKFVVDYNVERDPSGGEVIVNDGYFVHFFSPSELPQLTKHVLFVLDVSGSMSGRKMEQLKESMSAILGELNPQDYFNIIEFSSSVTVRNLDADVNSEVYQLSKLPNFFRYTPESVRNTENTRPFPATDEYKQKAKRIIEKMTAGGGTNIHDALKTTVDIAKRGISSECNATEPEDEKCKETTVDKQAPQPIIIFLTDGDATVGETRSHIIQRVISETNVAPKCPIFSLAFGEGADFKFLKGLSLANNAFARHIYEAADAQKQLHNFYRQLASPLLANVTFTYPPEVDNETLTKRTFSNLFRGSELVVAGKVRGDFKNGEIEALSSTGPTKYQLPIPKTTTEKYGGLERLWAYLTIRQLLEEQDIVDVTKPQYKAYPDPEEVEGKEPTVNKTEQPKEKALAIALKYSFVCPLTSLVVVKPNGTDKVNTENAAPTETDGPSFLPQAAYGLSFQPQAVPRFGLAGASFSRRTVSLSTHRSRPSYDSFDKMGGVSAAAFPRGGLYPTAINQQVNRVFIVQSMPPPSMSIAPEAVQAVDKDEEVEEPTTVASVSTTDKPSWIDDLLKEDTINVTINPETAPKTLKLHAPNDTSELSCVTGSVNGTCLSLEKLNSCVNDIEDLKTYKEQYLCELPGEYAGVCCNEDKGINSVVRSGESTEPAETEGTTVKAQESTEAKGIVPVNEMTDVVEETATKAQDDKVEGEGAPATKEEDPAAVATESAPAEDSTDSTVATGNEEESRTLLPTEPTIEVTENEATIATTEATATKSAAEDSAPSSTDTNVEKTEAIE